jgi:hypothetical protein
MSNKLKFIIMLKYALYRNPLTQGENDYMAVPQSLPNKRIEDIIEQITKPGSILKQTECVAVIHDFFRAITENLKEGYGFVSEYIRISPSITGVFDGLDDQFDQQRHQKQVIVNAAQLLKHAIEGLQLEKVQAIARIPEVKSLYDLKSQLINSTLSPGHMVELQGTRLKVNLLQKDEGIFLVNSSDGAVLKIQQIHTNLPSKLSGMLPDGIPPGDYTLEVRVRMDGNKNLLVGALAAELTVS